MAYVNENYRITITKKAHLEKNNTSDKDITNSVKPKVTENNKNAVCFESSLLTHEVTFEGLDDQHSICSDDLENEKLPPVPDGGWGWVVVVAAFLVSACANGLAFSFGLLHEEFTQYFETTQSKTSLIGSLFVASPLIAGPVMSALVDRFSCRIMTMIAGVLSTVGFLLTVISNSVEMVCLTFGLISGLAMGILYVTAVVSVAFWFDKKRNLAVSLASCGSGFGTIVYSPMTYYFLEMYDWRNTLVLLAGTLLNMCVCGALMADPEWLRIKQNRDRGFLRSRQSTCVSFVSCQDELKSLLKSGKNSEHIFDTLATSIAEAGELELKTHLNAEQSYRHSHILLPTFIQQNKKVSAEFLEKLMINKKICNPNLITSSTSKAKVNAENGIPGSFDQLTSLSVTIKAKQTVNASEIEDSRNCVQANIQTKTFKEKYQLKSDSATHQKADNPTKTQRSSSDKFALQHQTMGWFARTSADCLRDMPFERHTNTHHGAVLPSSRYKLRALSLPDIHQNPTWALDSKLDNEYKWYHRFLQTFKPTFDFRMLTEFHFLMFTLSSLILSVWFIVPYFFLQSYMSSRNIEGGSEMISIIGVANTIGIVALGWAGDQPWINVTKTYAVCLIISGGSVSAYPLFITSFWSLTIISTIFGLSFASTCSYTPTVLLELIPIDKFTVAYGLILLSQGIGQLVGPPIGDPPDYVTW